MASVLGVPREIKDMEGRVSMQPDGVAELVHHGHEVVVQAGAGKGAGFSDGEYEDAGARLVDGPEEVFEAADLIVKVKEPGLTPHPTLPSATTARELRILLKRQVLGGLQLLN